MAIPGLEARVTLLIPASRRDVPARVQQTESLAPQMKAHQIIIASHNACGFN